MEIFAGLLVHVLSGLFILGTSVQAKIRGVPGVDYPNHYTIPVTSFNCLEQEYIPGIYADVETGCQVFHYCYEHRKESFLCPPGTIFNQPLLACDYWYSSNCSLAPMYFNVNDRNQNRLHNNIPIVVKLQPDSSDEISHSTESSFQEMSSLYNTNSQFATRSQLEDDLSLDRPKVEQNFEDADLEEEDRTDRKSRSRDNFDLSEAEDYSIPAGFDTRNVYSHGQEATNENPENNEDYDLDPFFTNIPPENLQPDLSPYIDYKASEAEYSEDSANSEGRSIDFNSDGEEASKDPPRSTPFTSFSKRFLEDESTPKRSRRKPLYVVSNDDDEVLTLLPKTRRTRGYPYIHPTDAPDVVMTTEIHTEPLTIDSVLNSETEFFVDGGEQEEMSILPTEASDIPVDYLLSERGDSSFLSQFEERDLHTSSDLEPLEETSTESLHDQSMARESSEDPALEADFQDESYRNDDSDVMVSDEIPQEEDVNQDNQDGQPEEPDDTDARIYNEDSDSQYVSETDFPEEELGDEDSYYEENYPLYADDYLYQPEIEDYNDNQYSVETERNSEFQPYFNIEQRNMYADSYTDYRNKDASDMYHRSWYQPYGRLRSLGSFENDNIENEPLGNPRNRFAPELATGSSTYNSQSPYSEFVHQNPQYAQNENMFYSGSEVQNDGLPYDIRINEVNSFQEPSHQNLENYSQSIYALPGDSHYSSDQPVDTVNYSQVNGNFGEDVYLASEMKDFDSAERDSEVPTGSVLPSVDYIYPGREYDTNEDGYVSEYWQGEQMNKRSTEQNKELNKPDAKDSNKYPRYIEELFEKWEKIYLKSLEDYLKKSENQVSNNSNVFEEREGEQIQEPRIPEEVRKQLAREAWLKLDPTGTTLCEISREDLSFKHLLTGKGITDDIREELKREALKAVYSMCFSKLEENDEFKEFTGDYVDLFNPQTDPETDEIDSDSGESEVMAKSEEFSHKAGKDMDFSFHKIEDEKSEAEREIPDQNEYVEPEFDHTDSQPQDLGMTLSSTKVPQLLDAEQVTMKTPLEDLETAIATHESDSTKDLDQNLFTVPVSPSVISKPDIFAKSTLSSDGEPKPLQENFAQSNLDGKGKLRESSDPNKESVLFKSPFVFSNIQEQSTLVPMSEQTFIPTPKPKLGKSTGKEIKQFGGSSVHFSNEVELLNQLALGNSKGFASQSFGNFPLELQQQHYNSFPSSIRDILAGQTSSGRPGAKSGNSRSSSLPRKILSMKSQKLDLLKKYLHAIKNRN